MANQASVATSNGPDLMALIGRVLIAALFVPSGWRKVGGFAGTADYIASQGLPVPEVAAAVAIVAELGLGLMLLLGWRTRLAALGLVLFTLAATLGFHDFWAVPPEQVMQQRQAFFKNLAAIGGLFAFMAFGPGGWSLDARMGRR